jgi:acyl carrier protein
MPTPALTGQGSLPILNHSLSELPRERISVGPAREPVKAQLINLLRDFHEDSDETIAISEETGIFRELGFESIDAIGLSTALEARFNQSFPFPEFMMMMKKENAADITVGRLLDFLIANLQSAERQSA